MSQNFITKFHIHIFHTISGSRCVGIGFIDPMSKIVTISDFEDNEVFSNLQSVIVQLGARECLLPKVVSM